MIEIAETREEKLAQNMLIAQTLWPEGVEPWERLSSFDCGVYSIEDWKNTDRKFIELNFFTNLNDCHEAAMRLEKMDIEGPRWKYEQQLMEWSASQDGRFSFDAPAPMRAAALAEAVKLLEVKHDAKDPKD